MTRFKQKVLKAQAEIIVDAMIEARGNCCQAAKILGIHRNTICRLLADAGMSVHEARQLVKQRLGVPPRKPVQAAVTMPVAYRRFA